MAVLDTFLVIHSQFCLLQQMQMRHKPRRRFRPRWRWRLCPRLRQSNRKAKMTTIPSKWWLSRRGVRPRSWWHPSSATKGWGGLSQRQYCCSFGVKRRRQLQCALPARQRLARPSSPRFRWRREPPPTNNCQAAPRPGKIQAPPRRCPKLPLFSTPPSSSTSPPPRSKQHPARSAAPLGGGVPSSMAGQPTQAGNNSARWTRCLITSRW